MTTRSLLCILAICEVSTYNNIILLGEIPPLFWGHFAPKVWVPWPPANGPELLGERPGHFAHFSKWEKVSTTLSRLRTTGHCGPLSGRALSSRLIWEHKVRILCLSLSVAPPSGKVTTYHHVLGWDPHGLSSSKHIFSWLTCH